MHEKSLYREVSAALIQWLNEKWAETTPEVYRLAGEFSVFFGWLTTFKQCTVLVKLLWLVHSAENYGNAPRRKLETRSDNTDEL